MGEKRAGVAEYRSGEVMIKEKLGWNERKKGDVNKWDDV